MPRKPRRYKLLLDENVETCRYFPILNGRHDLKHLVDDLKKESIEDDAVYHLAVRLKRLIVTYNEKDFSPIAGKRRETGVIAVSKNLSLEQVDKKITALLARKKPSELYGRINVVSGELQL